MRTISCGNSSVGRAQPCQGWGREFESRFPLQIFPSAEIKKGAIAKRLCTGLQIHVARFDSGSRLHCFSRYRYSGTYPARMVESVDTGDLKSPDLTVVPVQFRLRAPVRILPVVLAFANKTPISEYFIIPFRIYSSFTVCLFVLFLLLITKPGYTHCSADDSLVCRHYGSLTVVGGDHSV